MHCTKCGTNNPSTNSFCAKCGNALAKQCAKCKAENPPTSDFCGKCGASLIEAAAPPAAAASELTPEASGPTPAGERRHLTVLFCDLVGSTEMQHRLDPEESREIVADYQRAVAGAIERFGGHVAKYLGDGVMAYFGYPQAHDNDAERAVHAGLAILDSISTRANGGPKLSARIGIHSGAVVIGAGGSAEPDLFGDTPNLASRVQSAADPDFLLITAQTHRLISGLFVVEERGAHNLKGIAEPVELYRVLQASGARSRFKAAAARGLTPLVGREEELRLLTNRWELACEGKGQTVLISGEAGIGKSRLIEEFRTRLADDPHIWIDSAASPLHENTPFYAVTEMLREAQRSTGDRSGDPLAETQRALQLAGLKVDEALPLIAEMLDLPIPESYPPLSLAPEQKRKRLLATLAGWAFGLARVQPAIMVMEDLHWADPSTLELTQILVEQGATAPLMLLYTARPEFRAPWPMRAHHSQVTLNRLSDRQSREMAAQLSSNAEISAQALDAVVKRTTGVPLFVEELTRSMLESSARDAAREIPATLHDSLMARLDRLGPAKEVAQLAAVLGREFSYELLQAVSPMPEDELQSALEKLAGAELIYRRGIPPEATYQFKHALIQDAAYEALLKSRRKELHRRVAQTITERFAAVAEAQPQILARHWTEAGGAEPAIAAWEKAGRAADARVALKEAEEDYRQALATLNTLPESPERDARALGLVTGLSSVLQRTRGYSAPETVEVFERARALAEKTGNLAQLVFQGIGTWAAVYVSGDYLSAGALADQILDLAQREGSHKSLGFAHIAQVMVRFYRGDLIGIEDHFVRFRAFLEAAGSMPSSDAIVNAIGFASLGVWFRGHSDSARGRMAEAIALALDDKNPYLLAAGRSIESYLYRWLREPQLAADAATQSIAISEEHGFSWYRDLPRIILGWARAQLGAPVEGVALIRQGLAGQAKTGARLDITNTLTMLAEAQALDSALDLALSTIEDALRANPEELVFRPNILTFRGELRLKLGQSEMAESDFREAIALAQNMSAKAWELRATTSLARLLAKQGADDEARAMLANVYNWFSEGLDTADLKDAKALLTELGS